MLFNRKNEGLTVPYDNLVKYDYNVAWGNATKRRSRRHSWLLRGGIAVAAFAVGGMLVASFSSTPTVSDSDTSVAVSLPSISSEEAEAAPLKQRLEQRLPFEPLVPSARLPVDQSQAEKSTVAENKSPHTSDQIWRELEVDTGDNLSLIFSREDLSKKDLHYILQSSAEAKALKKIKPGQVIRVVADEQGRILELMHDVDLFSTLHIKKSDDQFVAELIEIEPEIKTQTARADIEQSLFLAGQKVDLSDRTIMELTNIFGWDIDFVLDIRQGDQFSLVFEEIYKNGEKIKDGKILAAEFINQDRKLRAVYYQNDDGHEGYYSDEGKAMQKAFLRTPVNFSRISSRFNLRRKHPVLNKIRAHKGVDYAAPHGTPIRATADGKITFIGTKGGYGRTVVMQHGDAYSTLYAHMSRFGSGAKKGKYLKQGQTIGYVGKTGLATGPHLHYEFRINGVHRNPLTVKLPSALPIDQKYLDDFKRKSAPLIAKLESIPASATENLLAQSDDAVTQHLH